MAFLTWRCLAGVLQRVFSLAVGFRVQVWGPKLGCYCKEGFRVGVLGYDRFWVTNGLSPAPMKKP